VGESSFWYWGEGGGEGGVIVTEGDETKSFLSGRGLWCPAGAGAEMLCRVWTATEEGGGGGRAVHRLLREAGGAV
jgi:hypothetical protein